MHNILAYSLYIDFSLSNDQIAFKSMIQAFAKDKMAPYANKWDKEKTLPIDVLREAATLGLGGIYVDEKLGGTGLGRLDAAIIFEELAMGCTTTTAMLTIHNMATWMVSSYATVATKTM